ncbi:metal-dependent hydrolase [Geoglobus acetivorans]|nr:metal-dependent hydrolase [Geoglobus acetivorans]
MPLYSVLADFDSIAGIKHRTYSHAIYAPFILSLPPIPFPELYAVATISYLSHIFADMLTPSGVMLLYPYRETTFSFLPPAWRIGTGTNAEMIFLIAVLLLTASFSLAESTKEVVAEFSAAVIATLLGYRVPLGNVKEYLEHYSFTELFRAFSRVERVVSFVVERTARHRNERAFRNLHEVMQDGVCQMQ